MTAGWVLFSAGRGPAECRLAVEGISRLFIYSVEGSEVIEQVPGDPGLFSVLVRVPDLSAVTRWIGTLEWVCKSPLRPNHGRKRWYIGTTSFPEPAVADLTVLPQDLVWETMRASGPGGQHVNKTESAVRLRHTPTGFTVTCSSERSQHRNKALALAKMRAAMAEGVERKVGEQSKALWEAHDDLVRGNPVLSFKNADFRLSP